MKRLKILTRRYTHPLQRLEALVFYFVVVDHSVELVTRTYRTENAM